MRFLVFILCLILASLILKYTDWIVNLFGKNEWAEKWLSFGGTYTMWKIIALIVAVGGILYLYPPAFLKAKAPSPTTSTLDNLH